MQNNKKLSFIIHFMHFSDGYSLVRPSVVWYPRYLDTYRR